MVYVYLFIKTKTTLFSGIFIISVLQETFSLVMLCWPSLTMIYHAMQSLVNCIPRLSQFCDDSVSFSCDPQTSGDFLIVRAHTIFLKDEANWQVAAQNSYRQIKLLCPHEGTAKNATPSTTVLHNDQRQTKRLQDRSNREEARLHSHFLLEPSYDCIF